MTRSQTYTTSTLKPSPITRGKKEKTLLTKFLKWRKKSYSQLSFWPSMRETKVQSGSLKNINIRATSPLWPLNWDQTHPLKLKITTRWSNRQWTTKLRPIRTFLKPRRYQSTITRKLSRNITTRLLNLWTSQLGKFLRFCFMIWWALAISMSLRRILRAHII